MNVLIVEDHPDVADTLQMGLEEYGYRVTVVHDGLDAEAAALVAHLDTLPADPSASYRVRRGEVLARLAARRGEHATARSLAGGSHRARWKPIPRPLTRIRRRGLGPAPALRRWSRPAKKR